MIYLHSVCDVFKATVYFFWLLRMMSALMFCVFAAGKDVSKKLLFPERGRFLVFKTLRTWSDNLAIIGYSGYQTVRGNGVCYIMQCRSEWQRGLRCKFKAARLLWSWVRIPPAVWWFVCCVCCQLEVSATSWSLVQRSPTDFGASLCVIKKPRGRGGHSPRWAAELDKIK
jgi:hypothetical protein